MSYNKIIGALGAIVGILSGCGSVDTYKETTYDDEKPIYSYTFNSNTIFLLNR